MYEREAQHSRAHAFSQEQMTMPRVVGGERVRMEHNKGEIGAKGGRRSLIS